MHWKFESTRANKIVRLGNVEEVFIVAEYKKHVLFYDDIDEGFEIGVLNEEGFLAYESSNQWSLKTALINLGKMENGVGS